MNGLRWNIDLARLAVSVDPVLIFVIVCPALKSRLISIGEIAAVELGGNGDGTIDFTGATLDGVSVTFAEPGLYFPTVKVTHVDGTVEIDTGLVQILNISELDAVLRGRWDAMKAALRSGNTAEAASHMVANKRNAYETVFNNLTIPFANIDEMLTSLTYVGLQGRSVEYEMLRSEGSDGEVSYMVLFRLDTDGVWRISFF